MYNEQRTHCYSKHRIIMLKMYTIFKETCPQRSIVVITTHHLDIFLKSMSCRFFCLLLVKFCFFQIWIVYPFKFFVSNYKILFCLYTIPSFLPPWYNTVAAATNYNIMFAKLNSVENTDFSALIVERWVTRIEGWPSAVLSGWRELHW